ncbi:14611_t:CDS:2, partial [Racocetra persica]
RKTKASSASIVGKAKLAERVHNSKGRRLSLSKSQIEATISETLEEIKKALLKGESIRFPGYFSLQTVLQKPRVAMNLQTKKKMSIPAKRVPKAKFSVDLKKEISKRKADKLNGRAVAFQAIDGGLNLKDGTDKYEVRTKNGEAQTVKFDDKVKDGGTAEGQVELEYKKESENNKKTNGDFRIERGVATSKCWFFRVKKMTILDNSGWYCCRITSTYLMMNCFQTQRRQRGRKFIRRGVAITPLFDYVLQKNIGELLAELEKSAAPKKELLVLEVDAEKFPQLAQRTQFRPVGKVINTSPFHGEDRGNCLLKVKRRSSMVEHRPSDPRMWVQFLSPLPAEGKVNFDTTPKSSLDLKILDNNNKEVKEKSLPGSDNILYNITETEGKIQLNFYKKDATTTSSKVLLEDQIKIEPKYYVTSEIAFSEGGDLTEEENSKPKLTAG